MFQKFIILLFVCTIIILFATLLSYTFAGSCDDWNGINCNDTTSQQLMDRLYLTTVTVTTVGYGDITPASFGAKLFITVGSIFGYASILSILTCF